MHEKLIKKLKEKYNITQQQLADELGIKKQFMSDVARGKAKIPKDKFNLFIEKYKVNEIYLLAGKGEIFQDENATESETIELPLIVASAGNGYAQVDHEVIKVDKNQLVKMGFNNFKNFVVCKIKGDSMQPYIIDGDLLIINTESEIVDGRIYIINAFGDLYCKKIRKGINYFIMESINKDYPEEKFCRDEMTAINVIGQVVSIVRQLRL